LSGEILGITTIATGVTERKRAKEVYAKAKRNPAEIHQMTPPTSQKP
jgi:hypothetical protein